MATIIDITAAELADTDSRLHLEAQGAAGVCWRSGPDAWVECWDHAVAGVAAGRYGTPGRIIFGPGEVDCDMCDELAASTRVWHNGQVVGTVYKTPYGKFTARHNGTPLTNASNTRKPVRFQTRHDACEALVRRAVEAAADA